MLLSRPPRRLLVAATLAVVTSAGLGVPVAEAAPVVARATPDPSLQAAKDAARSGKPVVVASQTTESSITTANPDGTFTLSQSSMPQRVRQGNSWVPIDTTLVRDAGGDYAPRAVVTDLSIGGGGDTDFVRLVDGEHKLAFTWRSKLPKPTVSGSAATYRNVLPDVDLQVTANASGYSSILVVKNAQAAANPDLQELDLGVAGTKVTFADTANGGAVASDVRTGREVFHTDTSLMWDSTPTSEAVKPAADQMGAKVAKIKVGVRQGKQHLSLDRSLLTAKDTKYPVFVDPVWSGNPSQVHWARISSNGWNIYNSTSTDSSDRARIGLDAWPETGGKGEMARTLYQMDVSGLHGAVVTAARLYVLHTWAASCGNTPAQIWGAGGINTWNASALNWDKQPVYSGPLSTVYGGKVNCGKSNQATTPGTLNFDVATWIKKAAAENWNRAHLMVQAGNMSDKQGWKQLGPGGGATLSVTYNFRPKLENGTGSPRITPSTVDQGRTLTTTHTPTLAARAYENGLNGKMLETVRILYQVYRRSDNVRIFEDFSDYSQYGGAKVTPTLPDGDYYWRATAQNASGYYAGDGGGIWTDTQYFTVDTTPPPAPNITSTQFPPKQLGAAYDSKGTFALSLPKAATTPNVAGYLFSLDGNLADTAYAQNHGVAWNPANPISPGTVYYAKADNGNGTGTVSINAGTAISFAPGTAMDHVLYARAVDQAGSSSPQTEYRFTAGTSSPIYESGDKMVEGWTATNDDGTTTTLPPATMSSSGGQLLTQWQGIGYFFYTGAQGMFGNKSPTSKIAVGDSATFSFNIPKAGYWEIGANLTTGLDYGTYSLVLDAGTAGATTLIPAFDAWSDPTGTRYANFGLVMNGSGPRTLAKGLHTLRLTVTGKNDNSTGYQAGIDVLRLSPMLSCSISDPTGCDNNTAISTFTAGNPATTSTADADGAGWSLDAATLQAAGWTPGRTITLNGAAIKLPTAFGGGQADNMLGSGQLITVPAGVVNQGSAVVLAGFATMGDITGATGHITYAPGSCRHGQTQDYTIDKVTNWTAGTPGNTVLTMPLRNNATGQQNRDNTASLFAISVPLSCPGATVTSISLPAVSNKAVNNLPSVHFLGAGIRPLSTTGTTRWVGSWSAAQNTGAVTTTANANATLNGQTIRVPLPLTIGNTAGGKVRVHVANSLSSTPVTFDAASIALADPGGGGADAVGTPLRLTFGGSASISLAAGADAVSDPITLDAPQQVTALVSLQVHGAVGTLSGHRDAHTPVFVSATDNANHVGEQSGSRFTRSAMTGIPFISAVDVSTSTDSPAGALVLYGDETIDSAVDGLDSHLTGKLSDSTGTTPLGVLSQGSAGAPLPPATALAAHNATGALDRDVLAGTNVRVALVSSGTSDLLACTATADACANGVRDKLISLATQLHAYRPDDAMKDAITLPLDSRQIKVYIATVPPFTRAHTAAQEVARKQLNSIINGAGNVALYGYADGAIDFATAVATAEDAETVRADLVSGGIPNDSYYDALAQQYVDQAAPTDGSTNNDTNPDNPNGDPIADWPLNGNGTDQGVGTGTKHTRHPASLYGVTNGPGRFGYTNSGHFDGSTSYAEAALAPNTARSFTFGAWVRLTDKTRNQTVLTRTSSGALIPLTIGYRAAVDGSTAETWFASMTSGPAGAPTQQIAYSDDKHLPREGVWTHLAVSYDIATQFMSLFVDGFRTDNRVVEPFNDTTGVTWIGRGTDRFAGDIADVQVWDRALTDDEISAKTTPVQLLNWTFDKPTGTTVVDRSGYGHKGTMTGGATATADGHLTDDPGNEDWAVHLDGETGSVSAGGPILRTDQSFTVSAWVRFADIPHNNTVVSQDGEHGGPFALLFDINCWCWEFNISESDTQSPTVRSAQSPSDDTQWRQWTHLTGVFDAHDKSVKLYINGQAAGESTEKPTTTYQGNGAFVAGRIRYDDGEYDFVPGEIDEVQAYQGALTAGQVANLFNTGRL